MSLEPYAARAVRRESCGGVMGMLPYLNNIPSTKKPHNPRPSDATRANQCRLRYVDVLLTVSAMEIRSQAKSVTTGRKSESFQHTHHCVHLGPHAGEGLLVRNGHTLQHRYI